MAHDGFREFFRPLRFDDDPEFRAELEQHWRHGLLIIGAIQIGMTVLVRLIHVAVGEGPLKHVPWWASAALVAVGAGSLAASRLARGRGLLAAACAVALTTSALLSWLNALAWPERNPGTEVADLLMVLLIGVAVLPMGFWVALGFCASVWVVSTAVAVQFRGPGGPGIVEMLSSSILCAVLAGASLRRMLREHQAHNAALDAQLRRAQSESAASMARIAAALSHELNTPLGALQSSVQSLLLASERMMRQPEPRLLELQRELARTLEESSRRLEDIVRRMQRFTNLDRAEVQDVDLRRLVEDVAGLCMRKHRVEIHIGDVPLVSVKPHVLSGALAELLQKATESDAPVRISAEASGTAVRLHVATIASAMSVDPHFGVKDGRMASVNWGLFYLRQLLRADGGDVITDESGVTMVIRAGAPRSTATPAA